MAAKLNLIRWISTARLIKLACRFWPQREFLVFRDSRLNRHTVYAQIQSLADGLHTLGIKAGDRVATCLPACPEAVYALFVPNYLGTIHMPLNPLLGETELREILRHSGARLVLTSNNWYGLQQAAVLARLKPELPDLEWIVVVDSTPNDPEALPAGSGTLPYRQMISQGRPYPKTRVKFDDPVLLCYTSGTTGRPKGVLHSYAGVWGMGYGMIRRRLKQEALECLLLPYPPYHYAGMLGLVAALLSGGKVLLSDRVDPTGMLAAIETEHVTQIGAPATIFRLLLAAAQDSTFDLSSVRRLTFSSEQLSPELASSLAERFQCRLDNIYGSTEAHVVSWTDTSGDWQTASETVGRPLPGVLVRIVGPDRQPVPPGEPGEIAVRSPQMMDGYYRDPLATAEVLDADGWYYTGDVGCIGPDGCLRLTGRVSDIIKRGGEKIHPEEVETFLEAHPAIRQAAVVGVPNGLAGEKLLAFIVTQPGAAIDQDEILDFCRGKIAAFKTPSEIRLVSQLPTTATGKLQRYKLRENEHA